MYQRILVPFDGSPPSVLALNEALKLAKLKDGKLQIVYVIAELLGSTGFENYGISANDLLANMRRIGTTVLEEAKVQTASASTSVDTLLLESHGRRLVDCIVGQAKAWEADLIVIGSHGRRGVPRLFIGSDAEQILRLSPVPVLLVRQPEA